MFSFEQKQFIQQAIRKELQDAMSRLKMPGAEVIRLCQSCQYCDTEAQAGACPRCASYTNSPPHMILLRPQDLCDLLRRHHMTVSESA